MPAISSAPWAPPLSLCAISVAPASVSRPMRPVASTARTVVRSIISSVAGRVTAMIALTVRPASATSANVATIVQAGGRQGTQPQRRLGDDAERALGADEQPLEVVARDVLDRAAAQPDGPAVGQDDLEREHVVRGHAVLHAAQPTGVRREVAPDRAELVGRGVGRVPEAVPARRLLDLGVHQPGLHHGVHALGVDVDLPHPLEAEQDAAVDRAGPAGQAGAGTAGYDRDAMCRSDSHRRLHVRGAGRANESDRPAGLDRLGPVRPVRRDDVGVHDHRARGQRRRQLVDGVLAGTGEGHRTRPWCG